MKGIRFRKEEIRMSKKAYNGLAVAFVPTDGASIITASLCQIISVQYYVNDPNWGLCDTETGDGDPDDGYSYNWNRQYHP